MLLSGSAHGKKSSDEKEHICGAGTFCSSERVGHLSFNDQYVICPYCTVEKSLIKDAKIPEDWLALELLKSDFSITKCEKKCDIVNDEKNETLENAVVC